MTIPPSEQFTVVHLASVFNCRRDAFPETMPVPNAVRQHTGLSSFRGIPFALGEEGSDDVILLDKEPVSIELGGRKATYILFLHVLESRSMPSLSGFHDAFQGNELGDEVSTYQINYANGESSHHSIRRRFAIQQGRIGWGASAFACVPALKDEVFRSSAERIRLGNQPTLFGRGECRTYSGREGQAGLWIYALPNPHADEAIHSLTLSPQGTRSMIFGISTTELSEHPCRYQRRRKVRLTLPEGMAFNAIDEVDDIDIDLGNVISARRRLVYDHTRWNEEESDLQPQLAPDEIIVEYAAHPDARLYLGAGANQHVIDLKNLPVEAVEVAPTHRPVTVKVIDKKSRHPVGVRIHFHGEAGEYLPPKGHHRVVNTNWYEDWSGEFKNGANQYVYIHGTCVVDLPLGTVYVEISRGYEVAPIRRGVEVTANTHDLTFELDRVLDWRSKGWVTADTHVHFLSPTTAVLEGEGEGVNVVNILASQWGELFTNVGDFDGHMVHSNTHPGNNGEFIARVGTENRMQVLGHISLLGYRGEMIQPLCTGGATESAIGDPQEVTLAEWAERCQKQHGLVVMPHAPNPQCERAADIVLGLVDALEFMTFNPIRWQLSPFAVSDWYRFLNLGYQLPLVGGSDKMDASSLLGGIRTYTQLGEREFSYENWMEATKEGHTFVTVGPLVDMQVEGTAPGGKVALPPSGGTVTVSWLVESVSVPIENVEVIVGGLVAHESRQHGVFQCRGSADISIQDSTWIAVRVRGSQYGRKDDLAAHTSCVQVLVGAAPIFRQADAMDVLHQIEGAMAYVDTIATRPDAERYMKLRLTLEGAYNRLHQRLHRQGLFHQHTPLHHHGYEH